MCGIAGVLMTPFFLWPASHELFGVQAFSDLYPRLFVGYAVLGVCMSIYGVAWELKAVPPNPTEEQQQRAKVLTEEADALTAALRGTPADELRAWHRAASPSWIRVIASL